MPNTTLVWTTFLPLEIATNGFDDMHHTCRVDDMHLTVPAK
ncbi:MAG: hypothetical protein WAM14_12145 [Candidatus Nitrosopolaris sp.]